MHRLPQVRITTTAKPQTACVAGATHPTPYKLRFAGHNTKRPSENQCPHTRRVCRPSDARVPKVFGKDHPHKVSRRSGARCFALCLRLAKYPHKKAV
ncbi:hypothetical protein [Kingella potus]|uniref:hypothetical protein n=1 Tax=Kingella potus TaxID=265175 RepID=UPI001FD2D4AE|nr:hypothetical protein [Kingella potus]UOP01453.1 hypothetical protein LVJ84_04405 [Kingella potus]